MVRFVCAALVAAILLAPSIAAAQPLPPVRLSVSTDGTRSERHPSSLLDISADGRHVLFRSIASNLVAGDSERRRAISSCAIATPMRDGVFDESGAVRTLAESVRRTSSSADSRQVAYSRTAACLRDGRFVLFSTAPGWSTRHERRGDGYLYDRDTDADGVFDEPGAAALSLVTTGIRQRARDGRPQHGAPGHHRRPLRALQLPGEQPSAAARRRSRRSTARTASRRVTTLVSSTPDGTPADLEFPAISAVMRNDGRIVALAGGFQALWPLTSVVVTYPWVLRDLESNTFTPVPAPPRPPLPPTSIRSPKSPAFRPTASVSISPT